MPAFVPPDFEVPVRHDAEAFRFRKLSPEDAEKDYAAVLAAREFIRTLYAIEDPGQWPTDGLTFAQDVRDLEKHAAEFDAREAFAYTVLSPAEDVCLGCVYVDPSDHPRWDAVVTLWGLDRETTDTLYPVVRRFVLGRFPFRNPAFPVFDIPLFAWRNRQVNQP